MCHGIPVSNLFMVFGSIFLGRLFLNFNWGRSLSTDWLRSGLENGMGRAQLGEPRWESVGGISVRDTDLEEDGGMRRDLRLDQKYHGSAKERLCC